MTFKIADRVKETCTSPGTGTVTLLGAVSQFQSFSSAIGASNTTIYTIADQSGTNWEVGIGTVGAGGTTLARTTVIASSNAGSLVNFSSGSQYVFCDLAAEKALLLNDAGKLQAGLNGYLDWQSVQPAVAAGRMWYDDTTGSWNLGMGGGNITQQVGEELFIYGKASAAISGNTLLQAIYQTGVVGASGVVQFAPTVSGITNGDLIIGVATEDIANNGFGRVTSFGTIHGVNTTGSTYSETWANGDIIWYNPVTGGLTKTKPTAPNIKVQIGVVINAGSGGSGSFAVEINHGSVLGGTDSNVQFSTLSGGQALVYDASTSVWRNGNLFAYNYTTTATAGGTTTLTSASTYEQFFTGSANQTVVLPVVSTLVLGVAFSITNNSTGVLTVQSSGGNTIATVPAGLTLLVTCILTTGTTAASWTFFYDGNSAITGTGAQVLSSAPTLISPVISTGYTAPNSNGSTIFGFKNRIINGAMAVCQQTTSGALTTSSSNYPSIDQFVAYQNSSANGNFTQITTGLFPPFRYIAKLQRTAGATTTGGMFLGQALETLNSYSLAGKTVTFSFYVYAGTNFSGTGLIGNLYSGNGVDQSFSNMTGSLWTSQATVANLATSINTTLTRYSFTGTVSSSATQLGFQIGWNPTGTAGADDSIYIVGIQLEAGGVATDYDFQEFSRELKVCERYFEKSFDYATAPAHNTGGLPVTPIGGSLGCGGNSYFMIQMKTCKRTNAYSIRWYDPIGAHSNSENWVRAIDSCNSGTAYGPNTNMALNTLTTNQFGGYSQVGTAVPPIFCWTVDARL